MAFLTQSTVRAAAGVSTTRQMAEGELRKSASAAADAEFDVFLSHSFLDAETIYGIRELLRRENLRVYVDWIDDRQLSREQVTPATAAVLRGRMRQSKSLIFATSESSPKSRWMPWELGYFDGFRPRRVAVLPLVAAPSLGFAGQEYIGLYPVIEDVGQIGRPTLGIYRSSSRIQHQSLRDFVASGATI